MIRKRCVSKLLICAALTALCGRDAAAQTRTFAANSIIVPVDSIYQTNPAGIYAAFGLMYRLLQRNVAVYQIINPAKTSQTDIDFSITNNSGPPALRYSWSTGTTSAAGLPAVTINYLGGPFVVDAVDYTRVLYLLQNDPVFGATSTFRTAPVNLHVATQGFTAPVSVTLNGPPLKLALINISSSKDMSTYMTAAGIPATSGGTWGLSSGDVYDSFNDCAAIASGALATGGYGLLWSEKYQGNACADLSGFHAGIASWLDRGNTYLAVGNSLATGEAYSPGNFQLAVADLANLVHDVVPSGTWPAQFGQPTSPYAQGGDLPPTLTGSLYRNWLPAPGFSYRAGVVHLWQVNQNALPWYDVETFIRKDNDPSKGAVIYLGGNDWTGIPFGIRMILNTFVGAGRGTQPMELARSSPVALDNGKSYQGTYQNQASITTFPPVSGHFREYPAGALAGSTVNAFNTVASSWDAAYGIPAAANRKVFTAAVLNGALHQLAFTAANSATLAAPMGMSQAAATAAINGIRGGGLGGIDHSTAAIVGPSTVAGVASRPTVAYVGALDGMLHAIAVSGAGVTPGQELWAFIPPSQLPKVGIWQAGVDGSPQVSDAFVDATGTGQKSWRTLLSITNGAFGGTINMLDITDPLEASWLWTGASTGGSYAMGSASGAAFGLVQTAIAPQSVVFVATSNAGTGGNGFNLYALDAGTGLLVWQWSRLYGRHIPGTPTVVPNDIPGVPAVVNRAGDGGLDDRVVFGDLEGRIWAIDAGSGAPPSSPLFDAGADGYPFNAGVALYRDRASGHVAIVGATGGKDWVPPSFTEYLVGIDAMNGARLFQTNLAVGERVYALPTVAGNDVFVVTSFGVFGGNIGATAGDAGNLRRFSLSTGSLTFTMGVKKGDSEIAVDPHGGAITAASAAGETSVANTNGDANAVALINSWRPATIRAWLDLGY